MNCPWSQQVSAYYDGELPAGQAATVEAHLVSCPACAAELAGYRRVSGALSNWAEAGLEGGTVARFRNQSHLYAGQRGVLRLAELLTGAAAAVLVAGLIGLFQQSQAQAQAEPTALWEKTAVTLRAPASSEPEAILLAEWSGGAAEDER